MIISAICFKQPEVIRPQVTRPNLYQNVSIDYTDPKMKQVMTEMTDYTNIDDLMAVVFQEYLIANNITAINPPVEKGFIKRSYCCKRKRIWRWTVCVRWCWCFIRDSWCIEFGKKK